MGIIGICGSPGRIEKEEGWIPLIKIPSLK
jgi:hypothetical protein